MVRSCFQRLSAGLGGHLADNEMRPLFEYHRDRIVAVLTGTPGVSLNEDTCAGFLNGFLTVGAHFVPDGSAYQESMFPVLGGIYLAAADSPPGAAPGLTQARRFFARLAATLDAEPAPIIASAAERATWEEQIRATFATTTDVPINHATLAGYILGLMYATPYLPTDDATDSVLLIATVRHIAEDLPI